MAIAHYLNGQNITTVNTGLNDGGSITLTGARPGVAQQLRSLLIHALGSITVVTVSITKNDGSTSIARFGLTGALPNGGVFNFYDPICGAVNDNMIITVTATGATVGSVAITANYKLANS